MDLKSVVQNDVIAIIPGFGQRRNSTSYTVCAIAGASGLNEIIYANFRLDLRAIAVLLSARNLLIIKDLRPLGSAVGRSYLNFVSNRLTVTAKMRWPNFGHLT